MSLVQLSPYPLSRALPIGAAEFPLQPLPLSVALSWLPSSSSCSLIPALHATTSRSSHSRALSEKPRARRKSESAMQRRQDGEGAALFHQYVKARNGTMRGILASARRFFSAAHRSIQLFILVRDAAVCTLTVGMMRV